MKESNEKITTSASLQFFKPKVFRLPQGDVPSLSVAQETPFPKFYGRAVFFFRMDFRSMGSQLFPRLSPSITSSVFPQELLPDLPGSSTSSRSNKLVFSVPVSHDPVGGQLQCFLKWSSRFLSHYDDRVLCARDGYF